MSYHFFFYNIYSIAIVQVLIPDRQIINIKRDIIPTTSATIYKGEWIYYPLSSSASLISDIYNGSGIITSDSNADEKLSIQSKQIIRSKVALIRSNRLFPEGITVEEEIANNLTMRNIDIDDSSCTSLLNQFGITPDTLCHDLSIMSKLLLDIVISLESNITVLILEGVISLISQTNRDSILRYIHQRTITDGLTVIICTDSNEIKSQYLGRELL